MEAHAQRDVEPPTVACVVRTRGDPATAVEEERGSAFFVSAYLAVTGFHCVGNREDGQLLDGRFSLRHDAARVDVVVREVDRDLDVALLAVAPPLPNGWRIHTLGSRARTGDDFVVRGYPHARPFKEGTRTLGGVVEDPAARIFDGVPALELYARQAAAGTSLEGFSGAPVITGGADGSEEAVGVVRWSPQRPDGKTGEGGTLYATPVAALLERWPFLDAFVPAGEPRRPARLAPRFVHGVSLPKNWADRSSEVAELEAQLHAAQTRVLNVVALGGTGKSTAMRQVAERAAGTDSPFDSMLWFSFYRDEDVESFFLEGCRYLVSGFDPAEYRSTYGQASVLQSALDDRAALLVLDGFERVTVPTPTAAGTRRIRRPELASFLAYVLASASRSKLALTSRVDLDEFSDHAGYVRTDLTDLSPRAAAAYLTAGGLRGPAVTIDRLARKFGYHALTLGVLLDYVRVRGLEAGLGELDDIAEFPSETTKSERLNRLLDHYDRHVSIVERSILRTISASPRGLPRGQLETVCAPPDAEVSADSPDVAALLRVLAASALVETHAGEADSADQLFDSHPLIRRYFYDRMPRDERLQLHRALLGWAQMIEVPVNPRTLSDIQPLLDVFWHASAAGDVVAAYATWVDARVHNQLIWWGNYRTNLDLIEDLLASPVFTATSRGLLLDEAGTLLVKLGQPEDGLESFRQAAAYLTDESRRRFTALLHLAEAQMEVGVFLEARTTLRQALQHCRGVPDLPTYRLTALRAYLAAALSPLRFAELLFARAIDEARRESGAPGFRCLCLRLRADLRVATGQLDAATEDYADALALATDPRWRFIDYEGHAQRGLGDLAVARGQDTAARDHYAAALDIATRTGYRMLEIETSAALARCALLRGRLDEAELVAERAASMAHDDGWLGLDVDSTLTLLRCALERGGHAQARELMATVRPLAVRSGRMTSLKRLDEIAASLHPG